MIGLVDSGLNLEEVKRIAQMFPESFRHFSNRSEQGREHGGVSIYNGVFRVNKIKRNGTIVGIDDYLDAVADIIYTAGVRLGIGIQVRNRVSILYPVKLAVINDYVRVTIELQERSDMVYSLLYVAAI